MHKRASSGPPAGCSAGVPSRRKFLRLLLSLPVASGIYEALPFAVWAQNTRQASDPETVRTRIMQMLVGNVRDELPRAASSLIAAQTQDGTWPRVDYADQSRSVWQTAVHLIDALQIAGAYATSDDSQQKRRLLPAANTALQWWIAHDLQNPNWWWNQIGVPRLAGEIALFLGDALAPEQRPGVEKILKRADWTKWTGQNLVWGCQVQVLRGLLTGEKDVVAQAFQRMYEELSIAPTTGEGIEPDFSFHQHRSQLYSGGYGLNFAADVGAYVTAAWGTKFQVLDQHFDIYTRFVLDGEAWMIRRSTFDYSACGREITRKGKGLRWRGGIDVPASEAPLSGGVNFVDSLQVLGGMSVPRAQEFAALAARIRGDRAATLSGNRHFWCSDYMAHHRPEFFTSVRMFSSRTVNTELINDEGKQSHHLADGCTMIYRDGQEYHDIFPVWDWSKVPGTTAEEMDLLHAGTPTYKTEATFVGGVSDGHYGAAAQELHRDTLRARKAWFLFDHGFVALGAGIACDSQRPVVTSVNQCLLRSKPLKQGANVSHDAIEYIPQGETKLQMTAGPQTGRWSDIGTGSESPVTLDVFNLWIDHGVSPRDASYAYLVGVRPEDSSHAGTEDRVRILSNTRDLQAVSLLSPEILFAVFWNPDHVEDGRHRFETDRPCILMAQRTKRRLRISIANPNNAPALVRLTTTWPLQGPGAERKAAGSVIDLDLPGGSMAGSTATREFDIV